MWGTGSIVSRSVNCCAFLINIWWYLLKGRGKFFDPSIPYVSKEFINEKEKYKKRVNCIFMYMYTPMNVYVYMYIYVIYYILSHIHNINDLKGN